MTTSSSNPFLEAKKLYGEGELESIMALCAVYGVVLADKDVFLCAYKTHNSYINVFSDKNVVDNPNTWYVYIASGNIKKAFDIIAPMEFVAFSRHDGKKRIYSFNRMRRLYE